MEGDWAVNCLVLQVDGRWSIGYRGTVLSLDIVDGLGLLQENVDRRGSALTSLLSRTNQLLNSVIGNNDVQLLILSASGVEPKNMFGADCDGCGVDADTVELIHPSSNLLLLAAHRELPTRLLLLLLVCVLRASIRDRSPANDQGENLE